MATTLSTSATIDTFFRTRRRIRISSQAERGRGKFGVSSDLPQSEEDNPRNEEMEEGNPRMRLLSQKLEVEIF